MSIPTRVLLRHSDGSRTPVDPQDVYLVEADGGESRIRTRNAEPLVDVRPLGELVSLFSEHWRIPCLARFSNSPTSYGPAPVPSPSRASSVASNHSPRVSPPAAAIRPFGPTNTRSGIPPTRNARATGASVPAAKRA